MGPACLRGHGVAAMRLISPAWRSGPAVGALALPALLAAGGAQAHVKWFAPYNVAADPTPLLEVFSRPFLIMFAASTLLVMLVHVCDRMIEAGFRRHPFDRAFAALVPHSADIMRVSMGAFLLALWVKGGIILTPELLTGDETVSWLQLGFAISTITWRTSWIAGLGIVFLYALAIANYGIFHLLDYPLFLGIAAFLVIHSLGIERLKPYALSILYFSMAQTLLWASVEKWAFGAWTMPLLAQHDRITLGIDHHIYLVMAGFVEFLTSFLLLYGRTSQRLSAMMLLVIFIAAIIDFGKIDAVGHTMIIAALAVVVINGNTAVNLALQPRGASAALGALEAALTYVGYLLIFLTLYYGAHDVVYGGLS